MYGIVRVVLDAGDGCVDLESSCDCYTTFRAQSVPSKAENTDSNNRVTVSVTRRKAVIVWDCKGLT